MNDRLPSRPAIDRNLAQSLEVLGLVFENAPDAELLRLETATEACLSLESSDAQER
jgi:hypothetical protein